MNKLKYIIPLAAICAACSHKTAEVSTSATADGPTAVYMKPAVIRGSKPAMIPKATAFTMSGDYADNVAITLDAQGNVTYYPAPTDITDNSVPVSLGNGWWLNRQGIGENSVFTRYTFKEYMSLKEVPSVQTLKASVIPGAKVTKMTQLPYTINEASAHIPEIKEYLSNK